MFNNRKLVLISLFLVVVSTTVYVLFVYIPRKVAEQTYDGARQVGQDIARAFQVTPEITVNNTVVLQQQSSIMELATLSQKFQHQYDWTNRWLGSTKKIHIVGTFEAKAGFDLNERFSVSIRNGKATVTLPRPKLLSIEPSGDVKFTDESGVWNWVDHNDRSKALNAFSRDARRYAQQGRFIEDARASMETRLRQILLSHDLQVEIGYSDDTRILPR
jgi:hypothetical protein